VKYKFLPLQELYFGVLVAAGTVVLLELAALNPEGVTDWKTWGVALAAGAIRAAAGAALDFLRRSVVANADPVMDVRDAVLALSPTERARLVRLVELARSEEQHAV
jgi:hypothetical protein